jgi:nicotinamidase-related amidase
MSETSSCTPLAENGAAGALALLIIDMVSEWDFPDGDELARLARSIAPAIAALKRRCAAAGVPTIYANDNQGRWRSDFRGLLESAKSPGSRGADIAEILRPKPADYVVLKIKHSAFHATPLEMLLQHLKVRRLILTGVTSDQCVLYTAISARMHELDVWVPADCTATLSGERKRAAVRHLEQVLGARTTCSRELALPGDADWKDDAAPHCAVTGSPAKSV